MSSIFTRIINREIPATIIAENNDLIVLQDIAPKAPIHYLIVPKKEIKDIQSIQPADLFIIQRMIEMAQWLSLNVPGAEHFKLLINSGEKAGQRVFHLHMHFLAGGTMDE